MVSFRADLESLTIRPANHQLFLNSNCLNSKLLSSTVQLDLQQNKIDCQKVYMNPLLVAVALQNSKVMLEKGIVIASKRHRRT